MDFNDYVNIFDTNTTCAEWVNQEFDFQRVAAAKRQGEWLHMAGTLEERPVIKNCAAEVFGDLFDDEIAWLRECFVFGMLQYFRDECDMGMEGDVAGELAEWLGER